jgi:hypothetical protein
MNSLLLFDLQQRHFLLRFLYHICLLAVVVTIQLVDRGGVVAACCCF